MEKELLADVIREYKTLLEAGDLASALPLIRQAAHWGDLESQLVARDIYTDRVRDPQEAFEYTKLAAMNGDLDSMLRLGQLFQERRDFDSAFYFVKKAAQAGYAPAYDPLSVMYLMGRGTAKDLEAAASWNRQAREAFPEEETVKRHAAELENLLQHQERKA